MYEGYRRFQLAHPPFRLSVTSQPVFLISSTSGWPRLAVWSSLHRSGQNRMITAKGMGTHGELSCPPSHIFSVHSLDMGALPLDRMSWVIIGLPRHNVFAYFALPHLNAQVLIRLIYHSWSREKMMQRQKTNKGEEGAQELVELSWDIMNTDDVRGHNSPQLCLHSSSRYFWYGGVPMSLLSWRFLAFFI